MEKDQVRKGYKGCDKVNDYFDDIALITSNLGMFVRISTADA